jgi:hypothetical protein
LVVKERFLMRALALVLLIAAAWPAAALAQGGEDARTLYVERRGLIEADARCHLLDPGPLDALRVGATQARGALLRAGWSTMQVAELESAVVTSARARACGDERTLTSARNARASFASWANAGRMTFAGWQRDWQALRTADSQGWRLRQDIDAPRVAVFGVRERGGTQRLTLAVPLAHGTREPRAATLIMRTPAVQLTEVSLNARIAYGLEAGAPQEALSTTVRGARALERGSGGRRLAVFTFPDTAFATLTALDPRESVVIELDGQRLLVEVGDIAAARAFLTIRR